MLLQEETLESTEPLPFRTVGLALRVVLASRACFISTDAVAVPWGSVPSEAHLNHRATVRERAWRDLLRGLLPVSFWNTHVLLIARLVGPLASYVVLKKTALFLW